MWKREEGPEMKIVGVVPARMASSRFPGKPLYRICGKPMIEHVLCRARLFPDWDGLYLATCNREIADFGESKGWPTLMTSESHERCLDRVAEAVEICGQEIADSDFIVCVQGDEPLLHPDMVRAVITPMEEDSSVYCTVLAVEIVDDEQFRNKDIVKIIHDRKGDVLYTSRQPIPSCERLTPEIGARRVGGILSFRWDFLKTFNNLPESPLERVESCDSNRILDNGYRQRIAPYPYQPYYSVDSPSDIQLVEKAMVRDPLWGAY